MNEDDLRRVARAHGVTTSYTDAIGDHHEVPESTLHQVLDAMGADLSGTQPDGAQSNQPDPWPPIVVVRAGQPAKWAPPQGERVTIALERGREIQAEDELPDGLPLGWHDVVGSSGRTRLVVVPASCWLPRELEEGGRAWGWTLQLYALRSRASWGIGDLRDLDELLRAEPLRAWAEATGTGQLGSGANSRTRPGPEFALLNPLHAASPGQDSPYFPSTRLFRNPLYLHIEAVPETRRLELLDRGRLEQLITAGRRLNQVDRIDRQAAWALKDEALRLCWKALPSSPERTTALAAWRAATPELERFATFRALQEAYGDNWREWPAPYRHPESPTVYRFADEHPGEVGYHAYVQWLLDLQLAEAAGRTPGTLPGLGAPVTMGIINDLAIGFAPDGFDAWTFQDELAPGFTIGAPPDELGPKGQDWGLPALSPAKLAAGGYRAFRSTIRAGLGSAGGLRIDHVMGLFRQFWVPEGGIPSDGTYVRFPVDDLLGILALESHRAEALIVGEDLGTVEEGVRERLEQERVLSYRVAWFERTDHDKGPRPAGDYPRSAMATATTHDLPTTHGYFSDADLLEQRELGLIASEAWGTTIAKHQQRRGELRDLLQREGLLKWWENDLDTVTAALYAFLARTPSMLVGVSLDDVIGALARPNVPGTVDERPNWQIPLPLELEEILTDPRIKRLLELLHNAGG